ncbi:hypothetical protein F3I27_21895 [Pantoea sp. Bo_2]|uniref:Uncharacterized protein n=1 Tax=Candidatus Pantoea gossypiicola TaxID=2608008 RepID=A0AB34CEE3_9GAMM|nr:MULTISPECIES: hypothetical protein [Pantoea]KAA5937591.1 hypothetical protein F3I57_21370 [Pantoea sp. VH_3]KAA5946722.1 hypothetical protein F3I56_22155 [Pantoea sp. VH_25]KAA5949542.1 hypothetical protein F3I55_22510 [Pantoea sp. VH_24]KAA5957711.1 hypothetical protein F3I53_15785 [Pantoea sp. VH_16]KAA5959156.1 hypothetical protein F3I54_22540 [Pantoea sp. VH_18]
MIKNYEAVSQYPDAQARISELRTSMLEDLERAEKAIADIRFYHHQSVTDSAMNEIKLLLTNALKSHDEVVGWLATVNERADKKEG